MLEHWVNADDRYDRSLFLLLTLQMAATMMPWGGEQLDDNIGLTFAELGLNSISRKRTPLTAVPFSRVLSSVALPRTDRQHTGVPVRSQSMNGSTQPEQIYPRAR